MLSAFRPAAPVGKIKVAIASRLPIWPTAPTRLCRTSSTSAPRRITSSRQCHNQSGTGPIEPMVTTDWSSLSPSPLPAFSDALSCQPLCNLGIDSLQISKHPRCPTASPVVLLRVDVAPTPARPGRHSALTAWESVTSSIKNPLGWLQLPAIGASKWCYNNPEKTNIIVK